MAAPGTWTSCPSYGKSPGSPGLGQVLQGPRRRVGQGFWPRRSAGGRRSPASAAVPTLPQGAPRPRPDGRHPADPPLLAPDPPRASFPGQRRPRSPPTPSQLGGCFAAGTEGGAAAVRCGPMKLTGARSLRDSDSPPAREPRGGPAARPTPRGEDRRAGTDLHSPAGVRPKFGHSLEHIVLRKKPPPPGKDTEAGGVAAALRGAAPPAPAQAEGFWPRDGESPALAEADEQPPTTRRRRRTRSPFNPPAESGTGAARGRRAHARRAQAHCACAGRGCRRAVGGAFRLQGPQGRRRLQVAARPPRHLSCVVAEKWLLGANLCHRQSVLILKSRS